MLFINLKLKPSYKVVMVCWTTLTTNALLDFNYVIPIIITHLNILLNLNVYIIA